MCVLGGLQIVSLNALCFVCSNFGKGGPAFVQALKIAFSGFLHGFSCISLINFLLWKINEMKLNKKKWLLQN